MPERRYARAKQRDMLCDRQTPSLGVPNRGSRFYSTAEFSKWNQSVSSRLYVYNTKHLQ